MTSIAHLFDYTGPTNQVAGRCGNSPGRGQHLLGGAVMTDATCRVEGCARSVLVKSRALCRLHWDRWRKYGDPLLTEPRRAATSNVDVHGYRRVKVPGHPTAVDRGWALEHRYVAWEHFGPFDLSMQVHHINGNKLDNRPANLELLTAKDHADEHHPRTTDRASACHLYRSGLSTVAVAAELGTHAGNIYKILIAEGVHIRTPAERKALVRNSTPVTPHVRDEGQGVKG